MYLHMYVCGRPRTPLYTLPAPAGTAATDAVSHIATIHSLTPAVSTGARQQWRNLVVLCASITLKIHNIVYRHTYAT